MVDSPIVRLSDMQRESTMKLSKLERELLGEIVHTAITKKQYRVSIFRGKAEIGVDPFPIITGKKQTLKALQEKRLIEHSYTGGYVVTALGFKHGGTSADAIIRKVIRDEIAYWLKGSGYDNDNDSYNIWGVHRIYSDYQTAFMLDLYKGWQEKHPESSAPLHNGQELCMWHYNESIMNNLLIRETNVQALEHLLARYETRLNTIGYELR